MRGLSLQQRLLLLFLGLGIFVVAMTLSPTTPPQLSGLVQPLGIALAAGGPSANPVLPTPAPLATEEPLRDPFDSDAMEFADRPITAALTLAAMNGGASTTSASNAGANGDQRSATPEPVFPLNVCLTVGSMDNATVPYAILEAQGGVHRYVSVGDRVGGATISRIDFHAVYLTDGRTLTKSDGGCLGSAVSDGQSITPTTGETAGGRERRSSPSRGTPDSSPSTPPTTPAQPAEPAATPSPRDTAPAYDDSIEGRRTTLPLTTGPAPTPTTGQGL